MRALMIRLGARARPRHFALITAHSVTVTLSHTISAIATERTTTGVQYIDPREIFILVKWVQALRGFIAHMALIPSRNKRRAAKRLTR